jgi:hypothetical protein
MPFPPTLLGQVEKGALLNSGLGAAMGACYAALRSAGLSRTGGRVGPRLRRTARVLGMLPFPAAVLVYSVTGMTALRVALPSLLSLMVVSARGAPPRLQVGGHRAKARASEDRFVAFITNHGFLRRLAAARSRRFSLLLEKAGEVGDPYALSAKALAGSIVAALPACLAASFLGCLVSPLFLLLLLVPVLVYFSGEVRLLDRISQRREGVEKELPFFSILVNVLGSAGEPLYSILAGTARSDMFSRMKMEGLLVKRDVEIFGISPNDSLEKLAADHPSGKFSSFLLGYCYDDETEVLTDEGWKRFVDLNRHEKVLSLDSKTNIAEFVKPSLYYKQNYEGPVYELKDSHHSFVVTPGHKMFCKSGHKERSPFQLQAIEDMASWREASLTARFEWRGEEIETFTLPRLESRRGRAYSQVWSADEKGIDPKDWLRFLGWFVSEGCVEVGRNGTCYVTSISQKKYVRDVEDVATSLGFKVIRDWNRRKEAWRFRIDSKQLAEWLKENCYEGPTKTSYTKKAPDFLRNLSPSLIEVFLESALKGDGHVWKSEWKSGQIHRRYSTYSKRLADDVQELFLRCGHTASIYSSRVKSPLRGALKGAFNYTVYERSSRTIQVDCRKIARHEYRGMIGCVEVPSHIVMVRRKGHPMWSGNTSKVRSGGDMPAYLAGESSALLRELEDAWVRYASRAGTMGSSMITLFGVVPLLLMVVGVFSPGTSAVGLIVFAGICVPLFTILLVYLAGRMQPVGEQTLRGNVKMSLILSAPGFGVCFLTRQVWPCVASVVFLFLTVYGISVREQRIEMEEIDEALPGFTKDVLEFKRQEYDMAKSLMTIAIRNRYNRSFDRLMAQVATQLKAGTPLDELTVDTKTKLAKMVFYVLGQMSRSGGGTVETVYQLSAYTTKVAEMRRNTRAEMRPYLLLAYASPVLLAFGVTFTQGLLQSFGSRAHAGLSALHMAGIQASTMPQVMAEASNLLIVVSAVALGMIGAKMTDFTVRNTLRASVNVVIAVIATHLLSSLGLSTLFHP